MRYSILKYPVYFCTMLLLACTQLNSKNKNTSKLDTNMKLELTIKPDKLIVQFTNTSASEISIWSPESFYGWEGLTLHVKNQGSSRNELIIKRKPREWTGSGSSSLLKIPPGKSYEFMVNPKDGWWDADEYISGLKTGSILVHAVYNIPVVPGVEEKNVFSGTLQSNVAVSAPPPPMHGYFQITC